MWLFLLFLSNIFAVNTPLIETLNKVDQVVSGKATAESCTDLTCHDEDKVGCAQQFDSFCSKLYSDKNMSNMDIPLSNGESINLRFGNNKKNDNYNWASYNEAKIKYKDNFPSDFKSELEKLNYFELLKNYTEFKKLKTPVGTIETLKKWGEVSALWKEAMLRTRISRSEKEIPNFGSKTHFSPREEEKSDQIWAQLRVEINEAIWKTSPEWAKVKSDFKSVKQEFFNYLKENNSLAPQTRKKMLTKINNLELILPGTDISNIDDACSQTEINASYSPGINKVTICAGLFSAPSLAIMAHEIAHSIDPHSLLRNDYLESPTGKSFKSYLQKSCNTEKPKCEEWDKLKNQLANFDAPKGSYYSDDYLQCLRQKKLLPWPEKSVVNEIVSTDVNSFIDRMAQTNSFLSLSVAEKRNDVGQKEENINFMNVCNLFGTKYENLEMNSGVVTALAYMSEYRCSNNPKSNEKLSAAVNEAKKLSTQFQNNFLTSQSSLTENSEMVRRGHSTPLGERVADNVGLKIAARVLGKKSLNTNDRRNIIFSSAALFCDGFTMASDNPELAAAQKEFSSEEHSQNFKRRRELMTGDIRKILNCEKDFETKDCEL